MQFLTGVFSEDHKFTNFHRYHSVFTDFQGLEKLIPFSPNFQRPSKTLQYLMYNMQPFMTFVSKYLQKCTSFYLLLLRNISKHCAHSKNTTSFNVSSILFSTLFVLFSCTPFGTKLYIYQGMTITFFPHLPCRASR